MYAVARKRWQEPKPGVTAVPRCAYLLAQVCSSTMMIVSGVKR